MLQLKVETAGMNSKVGALIKGALKEKRMTQSALAERMGVSDTAVHKWIRNGGVSRENIPALSSNLDIPIDDLVLASTENARFDHLFDDAHRAKNREALANTGPGPALRGTVPIISFVQAGDYSEAIDTLQPGEGERIEVTVPVHPHTFALRVVGDSMEPDFPAGIIVVVEPGMDPLPGDYVVAKNGDDATFKQLVKDGADYYLKPLNPRYPIKPLGQAHVIGVVREAIRKLR